MTTAIRQKKVRHRLSSGHPIKSYTSVNCKCRIYQCVIESAMFLRHSPYPITWNIVTYLIPLISTCQLLVCVSHWPHSRNFISYISPCLLLPVYLICWPYFLHSISFISSCPLLLSSHLLTTTKSTPNLMWSTLAHFRVWFSVNGIGEGISIRNNIKIHYFFSLQQKPKLLVYIEKRTWHKDWHQN